MKKALKSILLFPLMLKNFEAKPVHLSSLMFSPYICIAGNQTWLYRLPQSQIIMYSLFIRRTATM